VASTGTGCFAIRRLRAGRQPRIRGAGGLVVVVSSAEEGRSRGDKVVGSGCDGQEKGRDVRFPQVLQSVIGLFTPQQGMDSCTRSQVVVTAEGRGEEESEE